MAAYSFTGQDGQSVQIQSDAAMKAYLADGGLEFLLAGKPLALPAEDAGEEDDNEESD